MENERVSHAPFEIARLWRWLSDGERRSPDVRWL